MTKHGLAVDFDSYKAYRAQHAHPPYTKPSRTDIPPEGVTHGGVGGAGAVSSTTSAAEGDTFPSASTPAAATAAPAAAVQTSSSSPSSSSSSDPNAPYPTSFAHIVDLITKGEPVPGIREIPDVVWEGRESQSTTAPRKKPWETAARESSADVYNTSADSHVEGVANEGVAS
ncbi:MAG: hypothetical protein M1837_001568 [Sclerophora amabilis]|nr:MAG: hypothetical protein M1837_001568 [Sclerophora amabilis]